jgi:hypothetical protein
MGAEILATETDDLPEGQKPLLGSATEGDRERRLVNGRDVPAEAPTLERFD